MGYPVVARLGNLPAEIQNGRGVGGGCVVGWLPIVCLLYVNYWLLWFALAGWWWRREREEGLCWPQTCRMAWVISQAPWKRARPISQWILGEVWRWCSAPSLSIHLYFVSRLWRTVYILTWILFRFVDQLYFLFWRCVMALIRGINGYCPCLVCLIPNTEQRNITKQFPLRTVVQTKRVIEEMKSKRTEAEKEELLKEHGIRAVSVRLSSTIRSFTDFCRWFEGLKCVFWSCKFQPIQSYLCRPNALICAWSRWKAHMASDSRVHWGMWTRAYESSWWTVSEKQRFWFSASHWKLSACSVSNLPRWSGLTHFRKIINVHFSDASKFEDILKVSLQWTPYQKLTIFELDYTLCHPYGAHRGQQPKRIPPFASAP